MKVIGAETQDAVAVEGLASMSNYRNILPENSSCRTSGWFSFWGVIVAISLVAFFLGIVGFSKNLKDSEPGTQYSVLSMLFYSIKLFTLDSSIRPEPIGWELETARWLAFFAATATVTQGVGMLFTKQWIRFKLNNLRCHQIVCGFGRRGRGIVRELLAAKERVLIVDLEVSPEETDQLEAAGSFVIKADARLPAVLTASGAERAAGMFVVCGGDACSATVAAETMRLKSRARDTNQQYQIHLFAHVGDPQVFNLLRAVEATEHCHRFVELKRIDLNLAAARIHLRNHPIDYKRIGVDSQLGVVVIFAGWSVESEALLLQVARLCHLANGKQAVVRIISRDAEAIIGKLLFRYPQIKNIIEVSSDACDPSSAIGRDTIRHYLTEPDRLFTIFVAMSDDNVTLATGMGIKAAILGNDSPIFLILSALAGLDQILEQDSAKPKIRAFGASSEAWKVAEMRQERIDDLARKLHMNYLELREKSRREADPSTWRAKPADKPWDELPEIYRADNRHSADHLEVKLRAMDCELVESESVRGRALADFSVEEIEVMSKMEHARWNASKWLDGWVYGEKRDDSIKAHDNLVPYDLLSEGIKDYDRDTVRKLPVELARHGLLIVRKNR